MNPVAMTPWTSVLSSLRLCPSPLRPNNGTRSPNNATGNSQSLFCRTGLYAGIVAEKRLPPIRRHPQRGGGRVPAIIKEIGAGKAYPHCEKAVMVR
jgi:hypothetical protein